MRCYLLPGLLPLMLQVEPLLPDGLLYDLLLLRIHLLNHLHRHVQGDHCCRLLLTDRADDQQLVTLGLSLVNIDLDDTSLLAPPVAIRTLLALAELGAPPLVQRSAVGND